MATPIRYCRDQLWKHVVIWTLAQTEEKTVICGMTLHFVFLRNHPSFLYVGKMIGCALEWLLWYINPGDNSRVIVPGIVEGGVGILPEWSESGPSRVVRSRPKQ